MPRLFTAIEIPPQHQRKFANFGLRGITGLRLTPARELHVTLCFVGEVSDSRYVNIRESLEQIEFERFSIVCDGVGAFKSDGGPTFLWTGVKTNPTLLGLRSEVSKVLAAEGIETERRRYQPHVTVATLDPAHGFAVNPEERTKPTELFLQRHANFHLETEVANFALYLSELRDGQPQYRKLKKYQAVNGPSGDS